MSKKKNEMNVISPFLNTDEAAHFLRVKKSTIYAWIYKKEIMEFPVRYHGRKPVFLVDDLKRWSDMQNPS